SPPTSASANARRDQCRRTMVVSPKGRVKGSPESRGGRAGGQAARRAGPPANGRHGAGLPERARASPRGVTAGAVGRPKPLANRPRRRRVAESGITPAALRRDLRHGRYHAVAWHPQAGPPSGPVLRRGVSEGAGDGRSTALLEGRPGVRRPAAPERRTAAPATAADWLRARVPAAPRHRPRLAARRPGVSGLGPRRTRRRASAPSHPLAMRAGRGGTPRIESGPAPSFAHTRRCAYIAALPHSSDDQS